MIPRATAALAGGWLALLGLTLALSALAAAHDTLPGDTGITSWAQDLAFPGDTLADATRLVTGTEVMLAAGGVLAVGLWLRGYRTPALALAAGLVVLPLLQTSVKEVVDRPRPSEELVELRASFDSPSFPSGHVMSPAYLYGFLAYVAVALPQPRSGRAVILAACALVLALAGPANVWLGVHWPSDVLGGYAWGLVLLVPIVVACEVARGRGFTQR